MKEWTKNNREGLKRSGLRKKGKEKGKEYEEVRTRKAVQPKSETSGKKEKEEGKPLAAPRACGRKARQKRKGGEKKAEKPTSQADRGWRRAKS